MRKNRIKCYLCGNSVLYDEVKQSYFCSECNATHDSSVFEVEAEKPKSRRYRLTKFRIFVAVLAALFVVYYFFRFLT